MAVNKVPTGTVLRLQLQTGVDTEGNPVYRNKSLNYVNPTAADQDVFDVATALGGLQEHPVNAISRIDSARLTQI